MFIKIISLLSVILLIGPASPAKAEQPLREVLGISVGMSESEARKHLEKIGRLEKTERKQQEIWSVQDERFSYLIVGFDKDHANVRFVTAKAKAGAKGTRYSEVGDLKKARAGKVPGHYEYSWQVPPVDGKPGCLVVARGSDPEYLEYISLKRAN